MRLSYLIPKRHWSAGYLWRRTGLELWQRRNPEAPWLPPAAVGFLDSWLRPGDRVIELGAGRSTSWFAARVAEVISLEHDRRWLDAVGAREHHNVDLRPTSLESAEVYLAPLGDVDGPADLVLIDGFYRDRAALWALDRIAPGGLLVIDNAERHLPSPATGPEAIGPDAPFETERWAELAARTERCRSAWFDSGVTATLMLWP